MKGLFGGMMLCHKRVMTTTCSDEMLCMNLLFEVMKGICLGKKFKI